MGRKPESEKSIASSPTDKKDKYRFFARAWGYLEAKRIESEIEVDIASELKDEEIKKQREDYEYVAHLLKRKPVKLEANVGGYIIGVRSFVLPKHKAFQLILSGNKIDWVTKPSIERVSLLIQAISAKTGLKHSSLDLDKNTMKIVCIFEAKEEDIKKFELPNDKPKVK